jgi:ABC-type transporter Mla maintaining outer membrane lipid asymmetry ATPase subunit MlaF
MSAVLGYEAMAGEDLAERVWVETPGSHRCRTGCKDELLTAIGELRARKGARLVVLGTEVDELPEAARQKLLGRVGFVPANGGLISSLNAWENISLPIAYHTPDKLRALPAQLRELLDELGGVDERMLARLPEDMTLYEKRLAGFVRALLGSPELMVVENLSAGLGPTKRRRVARFVELYQRRCPGGTWVQLEEHQASSEEEG